MAGDWIGERINRRQLRRDDFDERRHF
jgi:hypothetical protein